MKEHQHIEWKESWRDESLKWIFGFANAEGGVLVVGRNQAQTPVEADSTTQQTAKTTQETLAPSQVRPLALLTASVVRFETNMLALVHDQFQTGRTPLA